MLTLGFLITLSSCGVHEKETPSDKMVNNLREAKIESDGSIHKYYGEKNRLDSVEIFSKEMLLLCKEYYKANEVVRKEYFDSNGYLTESHFRNSDSLDRFFGDLAGKPVYEYSIIQYNRQKDIIGDGSQGIYHGVGVPIGTWHQYQDGKLIRETYFYNDKPGEDYIRYKIYDGDGAFTESYSNNFILHETDSVALSKAEYLLRTQK